MDKEEFIKLCEKYNPIFAPKITKFIQENGKFYQVPKITWRFTWDEDVTIMATCDRTNNIVNFNLKAVIYAFDNDTFNDVEYFANHEIRHIFQHIKINEYVEGIDNGFDDDLIKQWKYEEEHYIKVKDDAGNINEYYFKQDIEMDAYAFALAVMQYKYGDIELYIPEVYGKEFYDIVDCWINHFKEEKL